MPIRLLRARARATDLLDLQIGQGNELLVEAEAISSPQEYESWGLKRSRWQSLTITVLDTVFSGEASTEFDNATRMWGAVVGVPWRTDLRQDWERVRDGMNALTSLQERLDYFDQDEGVVDRGVVTDQSVRTVFLVHGHDENRRLQVSTLLEQTGPYPVTVLHEQPNGGKTLIEKLETHAWPSGYAVVLLTGDDVGVEASASTATTALRSRARQNVVFELGFFVAALGRDRVCALHEEGVELPSDYQGVAYVRLDASRTWQVQLLRELRHAGLDYDMNKLR